MTGVLKQARNAPRFSCSTKEHQSILLLRSTLDYSTINHIDSGNDSQSTDEEPIRMANLPTSNLGVFNPHFAISA